MKKLLLLTVISVFLALSGVAFAQVVAADPLTSDIINRWNPDYKPGVKYNYAPGTYQDRELTTQDLGRKPQTFFDQDWILSHIKSYYINDAMYGYTTSLSSNLDISNPRQSNMYITGDENAFYTYKYPGGFNPYNVYGIPSHAGGQPDPTYYYGTPPTKNTVTDPIYYYGASPTYQTNW